MIVDIFIITFVMLLVLFLLYAISRDIKTKRRYDTADTCVGIVLRKIEDYRTDFYGSGISGVQKRRYSQYEVEYILKGQLYQGVYRTKQANLDIGSKVILKYVIHETTGQPVLLNTVAGDKVKELIIGIIGGVILAGILFYMKSKGMM